MTTPGRRTGRVLIVQEHPDVRYVLRLVLSAGGHSVLEAEDGDEAVSAIRSEHPDAVVAAIPVPCRSPPSFGERIGRLEGEAPPIVGIVEEEPGGPASPAPLLVRLRHPVDPEGLLRAVDRALDRAFARSGD